MREMAGGYRLGVYIAEILQSRGKPGHEIWVCRYRWIVTSPIVIDLSLGDVAEMWIRRKERMDGRRVKSDAALNEVIVAYLNLKSI